MINLKDLFGDKYRITYDESYDPKYKHDKDPWMMQIPCEKGIIYPHSEDLLALEMDYHPILFKKVMALPGVILHQDGDHEKTILFHPDLFDQVSDLVKPRKKRIMTEENKQAASERMKEYWNVTSPGPALDP